MRLRSRRGRIKIGEASQHLCGHLHESDMREVRVQSWSQFNDYITSRDGWAFRGQSDASWPLLSSLPRRLQQNNVDRDQWRQREERAIRIFRRKAHVYLPDKSALDDDLRCLAMMQHHGAPTRLLDFTKSPFVAAFFALEQARGHGAVYALNTPRIWAAGPDFDPSLTRDAIGICARTGARGACADRTGSPG